MKYPWVVVVVGDGYAVARNGRDGVPEMGDHYYAEAGDAQEAADWLNELEGITDAPRLDDEECETEGEDNDQLQKICK